MIESSNSHAVAVRQRGDIQGLRALAVLLVILAHAGVGSFDGGYIGVDVFFVISGFLITGGILREVSMPGVRGGFFPQPPLLCSPSRLPTVC